MLKGNKDSMPHAVVLSGVGGCLVGILSGAVTMYLLTTDNWKRTFFLRIYWRRMRLRADGRWTDVSDGSRLRLG